MSEPLPVYQGLVQFMGLDPELAAPACHWDPWVLDETYPPTVGELIGALDPAARQEEKIDDTEQESSGQGSVEAFGGGGAVPGGSQDGDPVGSGPQDLIAEDSGGASEVSGC